ncbi:hypothetical protein B296_00039210 [Ensete ventricosum]|uniref:Uncharacterized protein n=1 Tax=Ensete ventricosum TaxID=4639 RepID=A0A426XG40_ENSVE|nr:hypothetical protein B296_00039210 [Ensete ventricosum]
MELQLDDGPRSSLGIESGSNDAVKPCREFARRFVEGIGKLAGNMSGDHRKKTIGFTARMSEAARLCRTGIRKVKRTTFPEIPVGKPSVSDGWTARILEIKRSLAVVGRRCPLTAENYGWTGSDHQCTKAMPPIVAVVAYTRGTGSGRMRRSDDVGRLGLIKRYFYP